MSVRSNVLAPLSDRIPSRRAGSGGALVALAALLPGARRAAGVSEATRRYLLYVVLPVWLGAGFADYLFHWRTKIERTSGTRESMIHSLMMAETGIPLLMGLFFAAHEATAYWDVNYAEARRSTTPNEQHAHSFLEVIPFMALSMTACLNWHQAIALFGVGPDRPDFRLRLRRPPASRRCFRADPSLAPTPAATDEPAGNLRVEPAAQAS